jgi:hypothetical protein
MSPEEFLSYPINENAAEDREESAVSRVLQLVGGAALVRQAQAQCQPQQLNFDWLQTFCSGFPYWMGFRKVTWQRDVFGELQDRFTKTPCFKAFENVAEAQPPNDGRPTALMFMWPHWGHCVLHNGTPRVPDTENQGLVIIRGLASGIYTIENLKRFVSMRLMLTDWAHALQ